MEISTERIVKLFEEAYKLEKTMREKGEAHALDFASAFDHYCHARNSIDLIGLDDEYCTYRDSKDLCDKLGLTLEFKD